jgi:hypothetical protein
MLIWLQCCWRSSDLSIAEYLGGGGVGVAAEPLTAPQELALGWRKLCTVRAVGAAAERDATVYAPLLELDAGVDGSVVGGVGGGGGICAARKLGGVSRSARHMAPLLPFVR